MEKINFNRDFNRVIVIAGPTASGKTGVSIELSKLMEIEIVSADSRQLYKYLNIGTATPNDEELKLVKHHFISTLDPTDYYSAGQFGKEATEVCFNIIARGRVPVIVGGSGLYIKALCEGFFDESDITDVTDIREKLTSLLEKKGKDFLYDELKKNDPESAQLYSDKNPRRVIRALEYFQSTGEKFSKAMKEKFISSPFKPLYFAIDYPREELYNRINQRAEIMWKEGIIEETKKVLKMGYSPQLNSLNTVGYKEAIQFLNAELSENKALDKLKQSTRRYAKRQITWFKRINKMVWLSGTQKEIAHKIYERFNQINL